MVQKFTLSGFLLTAIILISLNGKSQTQPVPYALSGGSFSFTSWDSLAIAGTYPAHMIFQYVPSNRIGVFYNDSATDFSCAYNLSKRPRVIGYMSKGIGFVTTSSSQYNDCNSGTADHRFMGAALLALNSTNRSNIRVQFKSETLIPGDGNGTPATPRIWNLRLQYRNGTSGDFTDVPGPIEFVAGTTSGDSTTIGPVTLPAACNNKAVVQLRWIYFESAAGSGGTRPRLRLDDILVQSDALVGLDEPVSSTFKVFPNPVADHFSLSISDAFSGRILISNLMGQALLEMPYDSNTNFYSCSELTSGVYIIQIQDENGRIRGVSRIVKK